MRKLFSLMVALMVLGVVAGCGGGAEEPEPAPASDKNQGISDTSGGASKESAAAQKELK